MTLDLDGMLVDPDGDLGGKIATIFSQAVGLVALEQRNRVLLAIEEWFSEDSDSGALGCSHWPDLTDAINEAGIRGPRTRRECPSDTHRLIHCDSVDPSCHGNVPPHDSTLDVAVAAAGRYELQSLPAGGHEARVLYMEGGRPWWTNWHQAPTPQHAIFLALACKVEALRPRYQKRVRVDGWEGKRDGTD
jgi:hypothetical protein